MNLKTERERSKKIIIVQKEKISKQKVSFLSFT